MERERSLHSGAPGFLNEFESSPKHGLGRTQHNKSSMPAPQQTPWSAPEIDGN
jgi:hypothetical protein